MMDVYKITLKCLADGKIYYDYATASSVENATITANRWANAEGSEVVSIVPDRFEDENQGA